jgi:hypothetical protein
LLIINDWFKKNEIHLAMLVFASLTASIGFAGLTVLFPSLLIACSGFSFFGITPLAFLTTINVPLAVLALGTIMSGVNFVALTAIFMLTKQFCSIGMHVYSSFRGERVVPVETSTESSYDFLKKYLRMESSEFFEDDDDEEYHEISSERSEEEFTRDSLILNKPDRAIGTEVDNLASVNPSI